MHIRNHSVLFCFTCERAFSDTEEKVQHTCENNLEDNKEHETEMFENTDCEEPDVHNYMNNKEYKTEMIDIAATSDKAYENTEINELSTDSKHSCLSINFIF